MSKNELDYYSLFSGKEEDYVLFKRFMAYTKRAIKNHRAFYMQKNNLYSSTILPNDSFTISEYWIDLEEHLPLIDQIENQYLYHALLSLSSMEMQILEDHLMRELPFFEISTRLNCSVKKIRTVYYNTIRKLRNNLEEYYEFFF